MADPLNRPNEDSLRNALDEIQQSESRLQQVVDAIPALAWCALPDGPIEFVNKAWHEYSGLSAEESRGWSWQHAVHPDDLPPLMDKWMQMLASGEADEVEARLRRQDGVYRWFLIRAQPFRDESGKIVKWYGTSTDIDDRKKAEEALQSNERNLRLITDVIPTFIHVLRTDGSVLYVNQPVLDYTGCSLEDTKRDDYRVRFFHPDDKERLRKERKGSLHRPVPFENEQRVLGKDGNYRWFLARYNPLLDDQGRIERWYVASIDIQERKIAEEKIREQEAELREILDLTPHPVGVLGPDGSTLYLNRALQDYYDYGVSIDQWSQFDFVHPEDRDDFLRERETGFLNGQPHESEARFRGHDGTYRWFLVRRNPLKDAEGHITRWYVTATDIEDRRRAEEAVRKENIVLREEIIKASMFEEIVGNSPALQQVLNRVAKVAPSDSTALICGETGTGKELIARAIHKASKRANRAFVSVNCAAIPSTLIPSELFGHEKGAFTGANQRRLGRFELAEGGTIFLDEIGELPAETQVALLRVLQEREFERVGGNRAIKANVRVIVATNRDLQAAIAAGKFREDLFYRLNVFPIEIPPLRERKDDIPMLVQYFIDRYARKDGKDIRRVSKQTLDLFQSYPWPGNVRELQNVIERSVIVCETEDFSVDESWLSRQPAPEQSAGHLELRQRVAIEEREAIEAALRESRGRVFGPAGAAARLGISRSTLESKIKTLKIDKNRFKLSNPSA